MNGSKISVVIPTYGREKVLCRTLSDVLAQVPRAAEVIVVDQTRVHEPATLEFLESASAAGTVRWLRLEAPSIPHAMNVGLVAARSEVVLFLDDDVEISKNLLEAHVNAHVEFPDVPAVVGQVLQPGQLPGPAVARVCGGLRADLAFPFWSNERAWVANVMAGNLSVKRDPALSCGGFDENFQGAAYRFETEFARRLLRRGERILFEPAASLRHLRADRGGTRIAGSHLTSASPRHGHGDYYFAMQSGWNAESLAYMLCRPFREVSTRFHLRHPWYIPVKLLGELRGFFAAMKSSRHGARLLPAMPGDRPPGDMSESPDRAEVTPFGESVACRP